MVTVKVGRRGQITIPSEIRNEIGLEEGQTLAIFREGEQIIMRVISQTLLDLRGSVPVDSPQNFEEIRKQMIADRAEKAVSHGE